MSADLKKKAFAIVKERGLYSCMNDTKWNELRAAMLEEMPFPPPFVVKSLFDERCPFENELDRDVSFFGDWYYGLSVDGHYYNGGFEIEWIKVRPRFLKKRGALQAPELIDASDRFEELLNKIGISFEKEDKNYIIYGYR